MGCIDFVLLFPWEKCMLTVRKVLNIESAEMCATGLFACRRADRIGTKPGQEGYVYGEKDTFSSDWRFGSWG